MQATSFSLTCTDGHQMPMYAWLPPTEPSCVLHIAHGMAEYAERYAPTASYFAKNNIAVYAHDQRGHGRAVKTIEALGTTPENWFYQQVNDLKLALEFLGQKYPGKKIFLLGHSMGSFVAQRYFQLYGQEIDGLILSASNGQQDPLMGAGIGIAWLQKSLLGPDSKAKLIDKLSFGKFNASFKPNRTNFDWLSRNDESVDKYIADPLCGFVSSASYFYYFFKGIQDAFKKSNIEKIKTDVPVYCFAGDKDPVGLCGKGVIKLVENWKAEGVKDISYDLYKDGRHEMLNETNREEVLANILKFIKRNVD